MSEKGQGKHFREEPAAGETRAAAASADERRRGAAVSRGRRRSARRAGLLVALVAVLALAAAGGSYAWYMSQDARTNTFQQAELKPTVAEDFDGTTKKNVKVTANNASVKVYVRAQVTLSWSTAKEAETAGTATATFGAPAEDTDYKLSWGTSSGSSVVYASPTADAPTSTQLAAGCWLKGKDGYYYWSVPLAAGKSTENLIDECTWLSTTTASSGTYLVCDVSAQAIQANSSSSPFTDAWTSSGFKTDTNGTLVVS